MVSASSPHRGDNLARRRCDAPPFALHPLKLRHLLRWILTVRHSPEHAPNKSAPTWNAFIHGLTGTRSAWPPTPRYRKSIGSVPSGRVAPGPQSELLHHEACGSLLHGSACLPRMHRTLHAHVSARVQNPQRSSTARTTLASRTARGWRGSRQRGELQHARPSSPRVQSLQRTNN